MEVYFTIMTNMFIDQSLHCKPSNNKIISPWIKYFHRFSNGHKLTK